MAGTRNTPEGLPSFGVATAVGGASANALDSINTNTLQDGATAWCRDQDPGFYYRFLQDDATPAAPPLVVAPLVGPGRWLQQVGNQSQVQYVDVTESRDFLESDSGKILLVDPAAPLTLTLQATLSQGFNCTVRLISALATVTIASGAGVTFNSEGSTNTLVAAFRTGSIDYAGGGQFYGVGFE